MIDEGILDVEECDSTLRLKKLGVKFVAAKICPEKNGADPTIY